MSAYWWSAVLTLVGAVVGSVITWRVGRLQDQRAKREEAGRTIRWAAEQAVSRDERVRKLGIDALAAYADSAFMTEEDRQVLEAVTDSVLAPALDEIAVFDPDLEGIDVMLVIEDNEGEGGSHG